MVRQVRALGPAEVKVGQLWREETATKDRRQGIWRVSEVKDDGVVVEPQNDRRSGQRRRVSFGSLLSMWTLLAEALPGGGVGD